MNKVLQTVTFGKEPEISHSGNTEIARFSGAVRRDFKDANGEYGTDWFNFVAFGKNAEFIEKYFHKGSKAIVEGHLQSGSYTNKDGHKVYTTDIIVDHIEFNGSKSENTESKPADGFMNIPDDFSEELPFA